MFGTLPHILRSGALHCSDLVHPDQRNFLRYGPEIGTWRVRECLRNHGGTAAAAGAVTDAGLEPLGFAAGATHQGIEFLDFRHPPVRQCIITTTAIQDRGGLLALAQAIALSSPRAGFASPRLP